jgi:hypothetical protein
MGEREYFMEARRQKAQHQAHIARLISHSLTLLMYSSEREHPAHPKQTELIMLLGQARDAADRLAEQIDPDDDAVKPGAEPSPQASEALDRMEAALTTIRDTLPERQDAYARLVFATAAEALEPEANK